MNQNSNGINNYHGNNGNLNSTPNYNNLINNVTSESQYDKTQNNESSNNINQSFYQQYTNVVPNFNDNNVKKEVNCISKTGKFMMFFVLIVSLIIFLDNFITSMDWYWELYVKASMNGYEQLKLALETFKELIQVGNWIIVLIVTIISIIFLIIDKKKKNNVRMYEWYIVAGVLHIFIGTIGITPMIYSVSTLIFAIKNRKNKELSNLNVKNENVLVIFSSIIIAIIIFVFIGVKTNLFNEVDDKVENYQENKKIITEDNDTYHTITTFDKIISDWGNNVTKNKSYKIQNVKLNNITASLYIDYSYKLENEMPIATITFKHGDNELYTYTDKYNQFNLSYLKPYKDLILYGTNYCDNVNNGICEEHLTYSQVLAFNKLDLISLYDKTIINSNDGITFHRNASVFLEDENVYSKPYNDFRVYDIKINDDNVDFYTIVENYDEIFNQDYAFRNNNCDDPFWVSINFDMQRTFKTKFIYEEQGGPYKLYKLDNLIKQSSIKYSDYCRNKNILKINK